MRAVERWKMWSYYIFRNSIRLNIIHILLKKVCLFPVFLSKMHIHGE